MIEVKVMKRYKCDFCKKRSTKSNMEKHEKRCFRNPNRFCDFCSNTKKIKEWVDGYGYHDIDCPYCGRFDAQMLKDIEAYENLG